MTRATHDARPPIAHVLDKAHAAGGIERHLYVPATYVTVGKPSRLRVEYDPSADAMFSELVTIADEETTSERAHACVIADSPRALYLTEGEIRWLHAQLTDVVRAMDHERETGAPLAKKRA